MEMDMPRLANKIEKRPKSRQYARMDAQQFNVRDPHGHLPRPSCGFPDFASEPAYDEKGGLAGVAICPCYLWRPGF
jgi:hypothetical protein